MKIEEIMARAAWSAQSDEYNDWDALGNDEREALFFIMKAAIAALEQAGYAIIKNDDLFQLWINAFESSGEGWNGEFPMDLKQARWKIEKANAQIAAMIQQAKEDM